MAQSHPSESHYINRANGGTPSELFGASGNGELDHGETRIDANPLADWGAAGFAGTHPSNALPLEQLGDSWIEVPRALAWTEATGGRVESIDLPRAFWQYEESFWRLDSGCRIQVLRPREAGTDPALWGAAHGCPEHYDRDALVILGGSRGSPYHRQGLRRATIGDTALTAPLGVGTPGYEALQRGHTVVISHWSVGLRPNLWALSQLVEIGRFLDGPIQASPAQRHRLFAFGGSFGGVVAINAALWMPWLVRGVVVGSYLTDVRQGLAFQDAELMSRQLLSHRYDLWNDYGLEYHLPVSTYDMMSFDSLLRGWSGESLAGLPGPGGWEARPVDAAGMSLVVADAEPFQVTVDFAAHQLASYPSANQIQRLIDNRVPLVLVRGNEDSLHLSFFEMDLDAPPEVQGWIRSHQVPGLRHGGLEFAQWNETEKVYGQLLAMVEQAGCAPPAPSEDIEWGPLLDDASGLPHRSAQLDDFERRAPSGPLPSDVFESAAELEPYRAYEGLGADGQPLLLRDASTPAAGASLVASTFGGDVVRLDLVPGTGSPSYDLVERWRVQVSEHYGNASLVRDGDSVYALHRSGPLRRIDLETGAKIGAELAGDLGGHLRQLVRWGADSSGLLFTNDRGELVSAEWDAAANAVVPGSDLGTVFVEPGIGPTLVAAGGTQLVYSSPHGNLKRYDLAGGQPLYDVQRDLSEYLGCFVQSLIEAPAGGHAVVRYLGLDEGSRSITPPGPLDDPLESDQHERTSLLVFDGDLQLLGALEVPGPPGRPAYRDLTPAPAAPGSGALRVVAHDGRSVVGLEVQLDGGGRPVGITRTPPLPPVGAVASLQRIELGSGGGLTVQGPGGAATPAQLLLTLHTGQLVLVADPFAGGGPPVHEVLGDAFGATYGLAVVPAADGSPLGDELIALGPGGSYLHIDPRTGGPGTSPRAPQPVNANPTGGFLGAGLVGDCVFGFDDGGDVMPGGEWVASIQWATHVGGQILVGQASTLLEDCSPVGPAPSGEVWISPVISASQEIDGGHSVRWADLDGDGSYDLVAGTPGAQLYWFRNERTNDKPLFPATWTGVLEPCQPSGAPDIGHRAIAMDVADMDDDGDDEVIVGTMLAARCDSSSEMVPRGGITVVDLDPTTSRLVARIPDGATSTSSYELRDGQHGVYGLRHVDLSGGQGRHDLLVTTVTGQLLVLRYLPRGPHEAGCFSLLREYGSIAPGLGSYDSIRTFALADGSTRVVMASASGLVGVDLPPIPEGTVCLSGTPSTLPFVQGGTQVLQLDAGPEHAGGIYVLGTSKLEGVVGFELDGFTIPLASDWVLAHTLAGGFPSMNFGVGMLDGEGRQEAHLVIPAGAAQSGMLSTLLSAFVVVDPSTLGVTAVSGPVQLSLVAP